MNARTTNMIMRNEDYFVADLDNGAVRFGMYNICMFDFPATHAEFSKVKNLDLSKAEDLFDEYFARYIPAQTDGYA